jgi:hypothetical protein
VTYLMELERHGFLGGTPERARAAEAAVLLVSSARDAFIELAQRELTVGG